MLSRDGSIERFEGDLYRQLLETAPDAIVVVDEHANIELVNVQTEKLFGYDRAELVHQPLGLLIPKRFHASHDAHMTRFFSTPFARQMGSGIELFGLRKNGTELPIEVSLSPLRTKSRVLVSAAIRDVTDRNKIQLAAKVTAERLTSAVEIIEDAFALFDSQATMVLCNSVYRRLIGETLSGALVGKSFEQILDATLDIFLFETEEQRALFKAARSSNRDDAGGTYEVRANGDRRFRVSNRRTPEGGIVQTVWDVTEDLRLAEELRQARRAAEAGSAAKSDFLSSMSHELRTPLNAILGFAQLLQRDKREPLSHRHRGRVDQILKGGEHLLRLIDDILDLSRIEAGNVAISTEALSASTVILEAMTTLEPIAARAGIHLELAALPVDVPMIVADRTRFAQILMNFGSNAIKYNRPGGRVTFILKWLSPERVRVTVADTGLGIAVDMRDKIFQPFQRAGQETGPIEGTGIGLTISKRLAEIMGGTVGFDSDVMTGSTFWVDMPVHISHALSITPSISDHEEISHLGAASRGLVLYVEDNPANVTFMRDLLTSFVGIELITADSAEKGIELARERQPKAIIMDINFPGMSGLDALRILRELPDTRHLPVIALTAAASERDRQRGEKAGFFRYLTKPVKVDELEAALELLLTPS